MWAVVGEMLQDLPAGTITEIQEHPTWPGCLLVRADWKEVPVGWTLVGTGGEWDVVEADGWWATLRPARPGCKLHKWDVLYYLW